MAPVPNNVLSDMLTSNRRLEGRAILSMRKVVPAAEVPAAGDVCLWATAPPTDVQGTRQNSELTEARFCRPKSCDFDLTFHFCKQKRCSSKTPPQILLELASRVVRRGGHHKPLPTVELVKDLAELSQLVTHRFGRRVLSDNQVLVFSQRWNGSPQHSDRGCPRPATG